MTIDGLKLGQVLKVRNQGTCITPLIIEVTIYWIGTFDIHYHKEGDRQLHSTPIERFMEIAG